MKNKFFSFFFLVLIAGCNPKDSPERSTASSSKSGPTIPHFISPEEWSNYLRSRPDLIALGIPESDLRFLDSKPAEAFQLVDDAQMAEILSSYSEHLRSIHNILNEVDPKVSAEFDALITYLDFQSRRDVVVVDLSQEPLSFQQAVRLLLNNGEIGRKLKTARLKTIYRRILLSAHDYLERKIDHRTELMELLKAKGRSIPPGATKAGELPDLQLPREIREWKAGNVEPMSQVRLSPKLIRAPPVPHSAGKSARTK